MIVGQKVVCVDDKFPEWVKTLYKALPVEGVVYVVRGVYVGVGYTQGVREEGEVGVYLIGLNNPRSNTAPFRERGFASIRFKPLDEIQNRNSESTPETVEEAA